jgi:serine/threonine-protein kinase HipA
VAAFEVCKSVIEREKVLKIAAFNVFSENRDDHSNNFSFIMSASGIGNFHQYMI